MRTFIANAYINKETLDKAPEKQWGINQKVVSKKAYHSNMGFVKLLGKKVLSQVSLKIVVFGLIHFRKIVYKLYFVIIKYIILLFFE